MFNCVEHYSTFSETRRIAKEFVHTWKINDFKTVHPGLENYTSALGAFQGETLWSLMLYPDGIRAGDQEYVGMQVYFQEITDKIQEKLSSTFIISFLDKDNKEREMFKLQNKKVQREISRLIKRSDLLEEKKGFLQNGNLIIKVRLSFEEYELHNAESILVTPVTYKPNFNKLENIFNVQKYSDIKIVVGDKEFWAYKGVLANQSTVFEAMFAHDMAESRHNEIVIEDAEPELVQEMLRYIYVGEVMNIEKIAGDLLALAEKYQLKDLKILCEETLIKSISVDTVTSLLIVAESHSAKLLKKAALNYFKLRAKDIVVTDKYKTNLSSITAILPEVIESLVL